MEILLVALVAASIGISAVRAAAKALPDGQLFSLSSDKNLQVTASFSANSNNVIFSNIIVPAQVRAMYSELLFDIEYEDAKDKTHSREIATLGSTVRIPLLQGEGPIIFVAIGYSPDKQKVHRLASRPALYLTSGPLRAGEHLSDYEFFGGSGKTTGTYTTYISGKGEHFIRITNFQTTYTGYQMFFKVNYLSQESNEIRVGKPKQGYNKLGYVDIPLKSGKKDKDVNGIEVIVVASVWGITYSFRIAERFTDSSL